MDPRLWALLVIGWLFAVVLGATCIYLFRRAAQLEEKAGWLEMNWNVDTVGMSFAERMTFQAYRKVYGPPDAPNVDKSTT